MEFVGVKSYIDVIVSGSLKREALIFNKIAVPYFHLIKEIAKDSNFENLREGDKNPINEVLWLEKNQIVIDPDNLTSSTVSLANSDYKKYKKWEKLVLDEFVAVNTKQDIEAVEISALTSLTYMAHLRTRYTARQLREVNKVEAYPIYHIPIPTFQDRNSKNTKSEVVQIAINYLPSPSETISWEQIIEYRSDPDSQSKFLALRHWMSEVARAELTPAEVEEKLEYLIDQYQQHMRLHRMKTNTGTLETIVTTSAEVLGDLANFKWGKAAQALFSLKHRKIALMEGELTSPGSEVAYIVKARETFS